MRASYLLIGLSMVWGCGGSDLTFPADLDASGDSAATSDVLLSDGACGALMCGGKCVDGSSDPSNCGGCGKGCPPSSPACVSGACTCPSSGRCGGGGGPSGSVDVSSDVDHCGACGKKCATGQACVAGACTCRAGTTPCGAACVETRADFANCGACGKACAAGQVCSGGVCGAPGCAAGLTACPSGGGSACVDTRTSNSNCGDCGKRCDADQACIASECRDAVAAPFCKSCPCPSCVGDKALCCAPLSAGANAFCVEAKTCPTP